MYRAYRGEMLVLNRLRSHQYGLLSIRHKIIEIGLYVTESIHGS